MSLVFQINWNIILLVYVLFLNVVKISFFLFIEEFRKHLFQGKIELHLSIKGGVLLGTYNGIFLVIEAVIQF